MHKILILKTIIKTSHGIFYAAKMYLYSNIIDDIIHIYLQFILYDPFNTN